MGEWQRRSLADAASFLNGFAFGPAHWGSKGLPIIRIEQMLNPGAPADRFDGPVPEHNKIDTGDLIMSWSGTIDVVRWDRGPALVNQHLFKVEPSGGVDDGFLFHLLRNSLAGIAARAHGTTMRHIKRGDLARVEVALPPSEEQRRIAEILDTIDEAIQATERLIAKLTQLEQGLRRDLMNGVGSCTRGEWRECTVGSFARVQRGASPRPIDNPAWFSESGRGWVRISDVTSSGDLLVETRDKLSTAGAARSRWVNPGDVIMSIAATIGIAIVVGTEACIHDGFVHVQHDDSVDNDFLVLLLEHHRADFIRSGQTGTQSNINSAIVADTTVLVPPIEEQRRIVSFARSARANIRRNQDFNRTLRAIRSGLSSDLLSGRVRTVAS